MRPTTTFFTETYVEFNKESVTEQRFPEDLDHDDTVIGQTLFNAFRRRVDRSEGDLSCRLYCALTFCPFWVLVSINK